MNTAKRTWGLTFAGDLCVCWGRIKVKGKVRMRRAQEKSRSAGAEKELLPIERLPIRPINWCGFGFLVILSRASLKGSSEIQPFWGGGWECISSLWTLHWIGIHSVSSNYTSKSCFHFYLLTSFYQETTAKLCQNHINHIRATFPFHQRIDVCSMD